ncbi:unnamed protein product [Aureobasidium uvarum]|uniref:Xylanolytic transcriptional activator regulatory domain-containing protein n=1 Tax=Aureobasidium uvarum TaxID=2773716 RepID=A0A9N8PUM6_9PEZI|nr:unnamed protein product [Aureobasidium uvarum]
MKRSAPSSSAHEEQQATRRRQDPVSCQNAGHLVQRDGLRVWRGKTIDARPVAVVVADGNSRSSSVMPAASDSSVLAKVLERLQRLEDIVLTKPDNVVSDNVVPDDDTRNKVVGAVGQTSIPRLHEDVAQNDIFHSIGRSNASSQANLSIEQREDEFRATEIIGSRPTAQDGNDASFTFTSANVSEIAFDLNLETPILTNIAVNGSRVIRRICLPGREEAHILFQSFAKSLGSWYHIYHKQTIEMLLDKTCYQIACGNVPDLSHAALLLSIFASGAYFLAFTSSGCVLADPQVANQLSVNWKQNALDMLDHIERVSTPTTVEQVQATIIMSLVIQNFEGMYNVITEMAILSIKGLSKKYWLLHSTSITLARDLSIHVLDHPGRPKASGLVENEVKRRVWWYLATTDWLLGSMPSPQEGTYSINPRHSHVNRPMNIDDEDLVCENASDKPLSEPTEMSYFLVRTHGGEVCRVLADLVHPLASGVNSVDYDEIVALEQKTSGLTENMPFYFQLDEDSRKKTEPYLSKYPQLATQRYLLQQGLHCHRSRIHRPFLIRGSLDARFHFSRKACLESVRKSLEIRRLLNQEKRGMVLPISRLNFVLYHIFMAALTLALDLCFNKSATEAEDRIRRAELKEACFMLQESKTEMPAANRFLTPLMGLLRKHKIQLQDTGSQNQYLTPSETTGTPGIQSKGNSYPDQCMSNQTRSLPEYNASLTAAIPDLDFDGLWDEFIDMVPDSSAPGWNDLLADFDQASLFLGV